MPVEDSGLRTKCEFGRRNVQRATCGVGTDVDVYVNTVPSHSGFFLLLVLFAVCTPRAEY